MGTLHPLEHRKNAMIHYLVFDIETRVDKELVRKCTTRRTVSLEQAYDTARDQIPNEADSRVTFPFRSTPHLHLTLQADENYRIRALGAWHRQAFRDGAGCEIQSNCWAFKLRYLQRRGLIFLYLRLAPLNTDFVAALFCCRAGKGLSAADTAMPIISTCAIFYRISARLSPEFLKCLAKDRSPGKYSIAGGNVEYLYRQGRSEITSTMTDVLQTYLLFLARSCCADEWIPMLIRGRVCSRGFDAKAAERERKIFQDFLQRWKLSQ